MKKQAAPPKPVDTYNLNRFLNAQEDAYDGALSEIRKGAKYAHWMWFIFPQYDGLGSTSTTHYYAIKSIAEAQAYLDHPILGSRLHECCTAVLGVTGRTANQIFGTPDDLKLRSCMTLFAQLTGKSSVFERVLAAYYDGQTDSQTLDLLAK